MNKTQIFVITALSIAIAGLCFRGRNGNQNIDAHSGEQAVEVFGKCNVPTAPSAEPPRMIGNFEGVSKAPVWTAVNPTDSEVIQASYFGGTVPFKLVKATEEKIPKWIWSNEFLDKGIWLRENSQGTQEIKVLLDGIEAAASFEIANPPTGVTATLANKVLSLVFTTPSTYKLSVKKTVDNRIEVSNSGNDLPNLIVHVPDTSKIPSEPSILRVQLGKNYPLLDVEKETLLIGKGQATTVVVEGQVASKEDELYGVLLYSSDTSTGDLTVLKVVSGSAVATSNTNFNLINIPFTLREEEPDNILIKNPSISFFSKRKGFENHKFASKGKELSFQFAEYQRINKSTLTLTVGNPTRTASSGQIFLLSRTLLPLNVAVQNAEASPADKAAAAYQLLIDDKPIETKLSAAGLSFNIDELQDQRHTITVKVLLGDKTVQESSQPANASIELQTGRFYVTNVVPKDFGMRLGANQLVISFSRPMTFADENKFNEELTKSISINLSSSGTVEGPFSTGSGTAHSPQFSIDASRAKITVTFDSVNPGLHKLVISGLKISDVYGNKLEGNSGKPGEDYEVILGQATSNALASDPLVPGITRGKAPVVEYPSFIPTKEPPRGFNPNDKVETRVARLYFYRDAHRVAQILNRRAQSYNRQDVTMRRQMADKARQEAESVTNQRQISERDAVDKARRTRELENQMSDAQRTLNYSLQQMQQLAVQPISDPNSEAAKRREAQLAQLELAARSNAEQVRSLESRISSARDTEVSANERWQQTQRSEELSRAEQFRLETAAAHADPDTFAEGKPDSVDAVHQVSISVIGEGVLHLRGPLRGVNQVRMMVDQIDSPCGQVRVNVHSTQINGEAADELETVANRIQTYIDQARFLTLQSGEMLRKAVLHTAAARAEEARGLFPGESQADRDQRYLVSFFGKDFVDELRAMDSEFLMTGNKLLSLHSMDVTSLSSALTVMALANNGTRFAIWQEFERLIQTDLSMAEQQFLQNSIAECTGKKCKHGCKGTCKHNQPPPVFQLTGNATFTGLRGFFDANVPHDDTMTPLQREVIRLAQILKGRLITELELKQRVMERAVIEERLGAAEDEADQLRRERDSISSLREATKQSLQFRSTLLPSLTQATAEIDSVLNDYRSSSQDVLNQLDALTQLVCRFGDHSRTLVDRFVRVQNLILQTSSARRHLAAVTTVFDEQGLAIIPAASISSEFGLDLILKGPNEATTIANMHQDDIDNLFYLGGTQKQQEDLQAAVRKISERLNRVQETSKQFRSKDDPSITKMESLKISFEKSVEKTKSVRILLDRHPERYLIISVFDLKNALNDIAFLIATQQETARAWEEIGKSKFDLLAYVDSIFSSQQGEQLNTKHATKAYQEWIGFEQKIKNIYKNKEHGSYDLIALKQTSDAFKDWIKKVSELDADRSIAQSARRPLDHKKFLDMLIDDLEEKYIELLEGTRAHTSNIDNYLKRLTTTLDDDFNTQFYFPVFRSVRKASQSYKVEFGQTETTNVLANNRELAKVSPSATMEFDLPKRDILIKEGIDSALAIYNDVGALVNDPNLLSLAKMQSGQSTASPSAGSLGGYSAVRNVYPGLSSDTSSRLVSQNAGSGPKFESNVEKLIPDPAIYKFETGTGYEIRPVIAPDGQAVVFDFNYMYTTQVREPVRADEKHLGRIKQHYIDTDVQLSNFELREVSRYVVALKAARTAKGVPLLEDIPVFGALWRPLPSDEKSLQQNIIMAQATIFPTLFDLMGLRWAAAVADMDPMRLSNREYLVRNRHKFLENRIYDYSSSRVDEFLRVPDPARRPDLYRSQETIPQMHPNGYQGPGLDIEVSPMRNGYDPQAPNRNDMSIPGASPEGSLYPTLRQNDLRGDSVRGDSSRNGRPPSGAVIENVQPIRLDPAQSRRGSTLPSAGTGANSGWEYSRGK